jgi:hypothetical protein
MEHQPSNLFALQIDSQANHFLSETARWAKFLSIVGFVMCGILVMAGLFAGSIMGVLMRTQMGSNEGIGGAFITVIFLLLAVLYFIPCLYLFRFSTKMQIALRTNDQLQLNASFKNLKACMRYVGIYTIIVLAIYILSIFFGVIGTGFR